MSNGNEKFQGDAAEENELDVGDMDDNKLSELMKRDPKFITRLISDLDKSMHKMLGEREMRRQRIERNLAEINRINGEVDAHIMPNLSRLREDVKSKKELSEHLKKEIGKQGLTFTNLERNAAALLRKATHSSRGITRTVASNSLQETRGFRCDIPTTTLIKTKKPSSQL
ncbi:hypothetical protein BSKO_07524 [Bryopsis sp. KO-2023]|nr:hypothetical protein BSKO_07524 [Bryopsis sp. KO-2023]